MTFFAYECPKCLAYYETIDGHQRSDGRISIRCPTCGSVERIRKRQGARV